MAPIPDEIIDRIRDSSDIVELVSRYVTLRKQGRNYVGLCPFHTEKTPSFTVNQEKQIFHCFGCSTGGNVFTFLMRHDSLSFLDAVQLLAREAGIEIPRGRGEKQREDRHAPLYKANQDAAALYQRQLEGAPDEIQKYLDQRGLEKDSIRKFQLGFAPDRWDTLLKHVDHFKYSRDPYIELGLLLSSTRTGKLYDRFRSRLMFPIHDASGRIVGFGARLMGSDENSPKYLNSPESPVYQKSQVLYGLNSAREAIREQSATIVVEGYMDFLQLYQSGFKNVVATSGTALTDSHARLIKRYSNRVYLCFDADAAGTKAAVRGGEVLFQQLMDVHVAVLPAGEDPDSLVRKQGQAAFQTLLDTAPEFWSFRLGQLENEFDLSRAGERAAAASTAIDVLTGFRDGMRGAFYVEQAAEKLRIPASVLQDELRRKQRAAAGRSRERPRGPASSSGPSGGRGAPQGPLVFSGAWGGEKDVLLLLINFFAEISAFVFQHLEPVDFLNPEFRDLFELIRSEGKDHRDHLLHHILEHTDNDQLRSLLLREIEHSNREFQKPGLYLQGCIKQMKIARYRALLDLQRRQLQEADAGSAAYHEIMQKMQEAMSGLKNWQDVVVEDEDSV